jgi:hypothetical protein
VRRSGGEFALPFRASAGALAALALPTRCAPVLDAPEVTLGPPAPPSPDGATRPLVRKPRPRFITRRSRDAAASSSTAPR